MNNSIEIKCLTKRFNAFTLEGVSLSVPCGYITGLIGPNGSGKTTTIKLVLGMLKKDAGEILLFEQDSKAGGEALKEDISVVMDQPYYIEDWRLYQVEKALAPFYPNWDSAAFRRYLAQFELDAKKKVKELSRGMKMKLQVAAALSHNAKLLILDEPTSGLDPVARDELTDVLQEFIRDGERAVLFSTHITADLEKIADYIAYLRDGQLQFFGTKDDFVGAYVLLKGGQNSLTDDQKKLVIGYRAHGAGFDGLLRREDLNKLPGAVVTEPASIDEIIVRMNKGGQ